VKAVSFLRFLAAWANAPFAIAGGVALLFGLLQLTGVLGLLAGGEHGEGDHDVDAGEAGHDVDGHDADGHDGDHDAEGEQGFVSALLAPLGFGRVPLTIIGEAFLLAFAFTGVALNARYLSVGKPPTLSLLWTIPSGLTAGYLLVFLLAKWLGPVLGSENQRATSRAELIGEEGIVISSKVTSEFGEIRIRDKSGHDLRLICRLAAHVGATPCEGARVAVVDYDGGQLFVAPVDEPIAAGARRTEEIGAEGELPEDSTDASHTRGAHRS
jgi:membrane protein implicated in regulation of membrane protease activity